MEHKIVLAEGQTELTVLTGKALDPKAPLNVVFNGVIDSPLKFLQKRVAEINQKKCHIIFDAEQKTIILVVEETDPLATAQIEGSIEIANDFKKFKINNDYFYNKSYNKLFNNYFLNIIYLYKYLYKYLYFRNFS